MLKFKAGNIKSSLFRTCCDEIMNIMVKGSLYKINKELSTFDDIFKADMANIEFV